MALHQHKVRAKVGPPEVATLAVVAVVVVVMVSGPLAVPGRDWEQTRGKVRNFYTYQNASTPDGRPYRVQVSYHYTVNGLVREGEWDGEWPEAHSPNALLAEEVERLREPGFPLVVFYDPDSPDHSELHQEDNRAAVWWLRVAIILGALTLWYVFVVYPRLKRSR